MDPNYIPTTDKDGDKTLVCAEITDKSWKTERTQNIILGQGRNTVNVIGTFITL